MNDTRILPDTAAVAAYVERVRAALVDLPPEDADDLTQGMEADLTEAMSEGSGDLVTRFGTPEAYAAELRSAAGLPPAAEEGPSRASVASRVVAAGQGWRERHARLARIGHELAPVWWLGRGVGAAYVVSGVLTTSRVLPAVLLVAASLYLGLHSREGGGRPGWLRTLDRAWTVGGLVLVPIAALLVVGLSAAAYGGAISGQPQEYIQSGLALDGNPIDDVYAYGADGKRLDNVRLFASDGRPITVQSQWSTTPWVDVAGRQWTNVYPATTSQGQPWSVTDPDAWHPPMAIDALVRALPNPVDPSMANPGADGAPTEAMPIQSATSSTPIPSATKTNTATATATATK